MNPMKRAAIRRPSFEIPPEDDMPPASAAPGPEPSEAALEAFDRAEYAHSYGDSPPYHSSAPSGLAAIRAGLRAAYAVDHVAPAAAGEPMMTERRNWAAAQAAGAIFYELPNVLDYATLDPLIAPICRRINESGWVATGESCQGHPDWPDALGPWAGNTDPFLRLTCHGNDLGRMLEALVRACGPDNATAFRAVPLRIQLDGRGGEWAQVYAYISAPWVGARTEGLAAFARFAESINAPAAPSAEREGLLSDLDGLIEAGDGYTLEADDYDLLVKLRAALRARPGEGA